MSFFAAVSPLFAALAFFCFAHVASAADPAEGKAAATSENEEAVLPPRSRMRRSSDHPELVEQVRAGLPEEFREMLTNIDVVVEEAPSGSQMRRQRLGKNYTLRGLYEGVPLTQRTSNYGMVTPDKITIFQRPVEAACSGGGENAIKEEIQKVVRHEIAHHFGIDDARLREMGKY